MESINAIMMNDVPTPPYIKEKEAIEKLKEYRRQVRDFIQGNIPFHEDEFDIKKPEEPKQLRKDVDEQTQEEFHFYDTF